MASAQGAAGRKPIIPLISEVDMDIVPTTSLKRTVAGAGVQEKRSVEVPTLSDSVAPELVLRIIKEFQQVYSANRLNLGNNGSLKFDFFRQILGGPARDKWDTEATAIGGITNAHFNQCIQNFIFRYIDRTALPDQCAYLAGTKKPYRLNCRELGSRLETINELLRLINGGDSPFTHEQLKYTYYSMMLTSWQTTFVASGIQLDDPNYTLQNLVQYMSAQEAAHNATTESRNRVRARGSGRGRTNNRRRREFPFSQGRGLPAQRARIRDGDGRTGYGYMNSNRVYHPAYYPTYGRGYAYGGNQSRGRNYDYGGGYGPGQNYRYNHPVSEYQRGGGRNAPEPSNRTGRGGRFNRSGARGRGRNPASEGTYTAYYGTCAPANEAQIPPETVQEENVHFQCDQYYDESYNANNWVVEQLGGSGQEYDQLYDY